MAGFTRIMKYILMVALCAVVSIGLMYGAWCVFVVLWLGNEENVLVLKTVSVFWLSIGGVIWLTRSRN